MVVGVCQISLSLPGVNSLKAKRSIVRRVLDRTVNRFNVAAAEIGQQDAHRTAVLGFAVVSGDRRHANSMLDSIASFVEGAGEAVVVDRSTELLSVGELGGWVD
ncbi:MAG: DUF503 domain-containing protein [Myxococcales bacterium]|nr:DUF503 domain-containing protein [Myxococcales bacterium]